MSAELIPFDAENFTQKTAGSYGRCSWPKCSNVAVASLVEGARKRALCERHVEVIRGRDPDVSVGFIDRTEDGNGER